MPLDNRQDYDPPEVPVPRFSYVTPRRRKEDLPQNAYQLAAEFVRKHGPWAVLCALLVYYMAGTLQRTIEDSKASVNETKASVNEALVELRQHSMDAAYFMRQQCINTSVLAGTPKELCDPPTRRP